MVLTIRALFRNCSHFRNHLTKPIREYATETKTLRYLGCITNRDSSFDYNNHLKQLDPFCVAVRTFTTKDGLSNDPQNPTPTPAPQESVFQKFKKMYRDYWYVLVPVHLATSALWFGGLYYIVKSGVDVIGLMKAVGVSEAIMAHIKSSSAGHFALAFALYKIVAPLRYAVTLGGTTYAIRRLTALGWIKPVPSKKQIRDMIQVQKDNIQDRFKESKAQYNQMKEKRTQIFEEMRRRKQRDSRKKNAEKNGHNDK